MLLVLKWMIVSFFLTMSYKAVLRASMMKIEYEKPIDNLDDLLVSNMKFLVAGDTNTRPLLEADPRMKVRELFKKNQVEYFKFGTGVGVDSIEWLEEG